MASFAPIAPLAVDSVASFVAFFHDPPTARPAILAGLGSFVTISPPPTGILAALASFARLRIRSIRLVADRSSRDNQCVQQYFRACNVPRHRGRHGVVHARIIAPQMCARSLLRHHNPRKEACNIIPGTIALPASVIRIAKEPRSLIRRLKGPDDSDFLDRISRSLIASIFRPWRVGLVPGGRLSRRGLRIRSAL
jgi:hypothetical protein